MRWTQSQEKAIKLTGSNLLVAAGAGSGKTAVLVERVISRVLDEQNPVDIDRFLVLTFTKAAASEMKEKIIKRFSAKLAKDPDNPHLHRQMTLIHRSYINTIHAFCNELVRENFHKLGLSSDFRTADETELLLLKADVARRVLDDGYEKEENAPFEQFLNMFTEARSDEGAAQMVIEIYDKLVASPYPEKLLDEMEKSFQLDPTCDLKDTPWGERILSSCLEEVSYYEQVTERQIKSLASEEKLKKAYEPAFLSDLQLLSQMSESMKAGSFDDVCRSFSGLSFEKLGAVRGMADHPIAQEAKEARRMVKEGLEKMRKRFFGLLSSLWLEDIAAMAPAVSCLCGLVRSFKETFQEEKKKRNIIDFSDQEHFALSLLTDEENLSLIDQIRQKYIEILVDEYQDTNEVQECIFQVVSGKKDNIFMVGDVKQSIYRFRQACPDIFLNKYLTYGEDDTRGGDKKVCLFDNFRSRQGILDFINDLFGCIMSYRLGEIDYNEREFLGYGGLYPPELKEDGPRVEVMVLEQEGPNQEGDDETIKHPSQQEATLVARKIKELMECKTMVFDTRLGQMRRLEYRDIVVLMRSVSNKAPIYEDVFSSFSIPVYSDAAQSYFDTTEIMIMFSLLRVIDNPLQDVALISVMRSGIFSFSEEEILQIRTTCEEGSLFDAVRYCAQEGDEKCRLFIETIGRYRQKATDVTVDQLIWFLYEDTRFFDLCGAMANGKLRQANLRMLFEYARKYEETSYKGLYNFLNFVNRLVEKEGDFLPAKIISENSDVVRIMSIHKSKGLEFPVCFVCETGARFNYSDIRTGMIFHDKLGFGPQFKDIDRKITYPTIAKGALALAMEQEMLCEEMRILYVALTRAKERLIITGRVKNIDGKMMQMQAAKVWQKEKIHPVALMKNASYLEWLLFFLSRHPDGAPLRQLTGEGEGEWGTYLSRFSVCVCAAKEPLEDEEKTALEETQEKDPVKDCYETLRQRLCYQYPFNPLSTTPAKVSVTEIKGRQIDEELQEETDVKAHFLPLFFQEPKFIKEEGHISPARRGTAIHLVMQYIDFNRVCSIEEIDEQIKELIGGGFLPETDAKAISSRQIHRFFESDLAKRIGQAKQVWREEKFNLAVSRDALYEKSQRVDIDKQQILVQGIIDCFFEEKDGNAVIIDFKTDKLSGKDYPELLARYQVQMAFYRRAVEEIYQKQVKDCFVYLFHTGETVKISL
jgi:ATP-dependent helicase/nuclease subunit A